MKRPVWLLLLLLVVLLLGGVGLLIHDFGGSAPGTSKGAGQQVPTALAGLDPSAEASGNAAVSDPLSGTGTGAGNGSASDGTRADSTSANQAAPETVRPDKPAPEDTSRVESPPQQEETNPASVGRQPKAQIGGEGRVIEHWATRLEMNADGSLAATFGPDEVVLWSPDSTKPLWRQPCHHDYTAPGAFSPDGKQLACTTDKGHAALRNCVDGSLAWSREQDSHPTAICFRPGGEHLFVGCFNGSVIELNAADGSQVREVAKLETEVSSLAFEPAQELLVACTGIGVHTIDRGGEVKLIFEGGSFSDGIALSQDGRKLVHAEEGGLFKLRQLSDGTVLKQYEAGGERTVYRPAPAGTGYALLRIRDQIGVSLQLWDIEAFEAIHSIQLDFVLSAAASADGRRAVTCSFAKVIRFWSLEGGRIRALDPDWLKPLYAEWMPDGRRLLVGDLDGKVSIRDADTLSELESFRTGEKAAEGMLLSPRGDKLLVVDSARRPWLWDLATRERVALGDKADSSLAQFAADGSRLYLAVDGKIESFDASDGAKLATIRDDWQASAFRVSPDGLRIVICGKDVRIYPLPMQGEGEVIVERRNDFFDVEFSQDGTQLAICNTSDLLLWDVGRGELSHSIKGAVAMVRFNPRGDEFICMDFNAILYRCNSDGSLIEKLGGAPDVSVNISWSPDGTRVMAAGFGESVKIWDLRD